MIISKSQRKIVENMLNEIAFNGSYKIQNESEHKLAVKIMNETDSIVIVKKKNYGRIDIIGRA